MRNANVCNEIPDVGEDEHRTEVFSSTKEAKIGTSLNTKKCTVWDIFPSRVHYHHVRYLSFKFSLLTGMSLLYIYKFDQNTRKG